MRAPANDTERRAMETAYESTDPFAIARHERPGCRYVRIVDARRRGNLGFSFVVAVSPEHEQFALLPDDQTITLVDRTPDAPTVLDATATA